MSLCIPWTHHCSQAMEKVYFWEKTTFAPDERVGVDGAVQVAQQQRRICCAGQGSQQRLLLQQHLCFLESGPGQFPVGFWTLSHPRAVHPVDVVRLHTEDKN